MQFWTKLSGIAQNRGLERYWGENWVRKHLLWQVFVERVEDSG